MSANEPHAPRSPKERDGNPEKLQRTSSGPRIPQNSSSRGISGPSRSQPSMRRDSRSDSTGKPTSSTPPIRPHPNNDEKHSNGRSSTPGRKDLGSGSSAGARPKRTRWGSRSVELFEKLEQIGEGTYGKVYMARNKETSEIVALKKVRMANEKEGFPITAIREIKILKELHHQNVVQLKEIVTSKASDKANKQGKVGRQAIYMVFEYMDHDLTGLMLSEGKTWKPTPAHIKCYMKQLLEGLHYCHSNNVLHRDIKGSNLLTNNKGELKLADFGLARPYTEQAGNYTNRVITLWYRPPELLLGAVQYGTAIDMWSAGCILTELLVGKAIFPGKSEIDQLEIIFKLCGTPTPENWPDVDKMPWWHMLKPQKDIKRCLGETLLKMNPNIPKEALDLVDSLLTLDPKKRITASEALDSDYFWTLPEPAKASQLPQYPSSHEYQAKKKRIQQQQQQSSEPNKRQKGPSGAPVSSSQPPNQKFPPYPAGPPPSHGSVPSSHGHGLPYGQSHSAPPSHAGGPSGSHPPFQGPPGHSSYPSSSGQYRDYRSDGRDSRDGRDAPRDGRDPSRDSRGSYRGSQDSRSAPPNAPPQRPPPSQDQRGRVPSHQRQPPPPASRPPPPRP